MKKLLIMTLVLVMCLSGCATAEKGTVSRDEYDTLKAQYNALKSNYDQLVQAYAEVSEGSGSTLLENTDNASSADKFVPETTLPQIENVTEDTLSENITFYIPADVFDAETVLSQLEVTEYAYSSKHYDYAFLAVKNNSEFNLDISVSIKFYNTAGELIGAKNSSENAFESGTEILFYFIPDEAFATTEYEFEVKEEDWYECVVSDLTYESVSAKNKEIVSVTNNGSEAAEFVEASALFFKGDTVIGFDWVYFVDDDSEIKPGKTITKEMDCYEDYDTVKLFFTGRR